MTLRTFSTQRGRLASLFFAVAVVGSLAACGGGGGGGDAPAPVAATPAPAVTPAPALPATSELVLTSATPSKANGTMTTAASTFQRESNPGNASTSGGRPFCTITVDKAANGTSTYVIVVNYVQSNGEVLNVAIDDETFKRGPNYGGDLSAPASSVVSVNLALKTISFNNALVEDTLIGTKATVNGKLSFGVPGSTSPCGS
jgi:hypothetical protein